jgi:hypothetical protein
MKNYSQIAILTLYLGLVGTTVAKAATANFQGNCTNTSGWNSCLFSPNKAPAGEPYTGCNGAGVSAYFWDFGDASSATTYPNVDAGRIRHVFPPNFIGGGVWVAMDVYCLNGDHAVVAQCIEVNPTPGCIVVNGGWTP